MSSAKLKINSHKEQTLSLKQARKKDALALAELIYDIYKERKSRKAKGQNANHSTTEK